MLNVSIPKPFIAGCLTFWAISSLQMDYLGMEGTIRDIVNHWVSWHYTVPLALVALFTARKLCREAAQGGGA